MKNLIKAILLISILVACEPKGAPEGSIEQFDRHRLDATIELTNEGLIYNGSKLDLDAPIRAWTDVLGPARDSSIEGILVWDGLGIWTSTKSVDDDRVDFATIILRREPSPTYSNTPRLGERLHPLELYNGRLMWKGVPFDKETTIQDLRTKARTMIHCVKGTGGCFATGLPGEAETSSYIAFQSDSRLDRSPIYRVSVGRDLAISSDP